MQLKKILQMSYAYDFIITFLNVSKPSKEQTLWLEKHKHKWQMFALFHHLSLIQL